jgi:hypothetical protein
LSSLPFWLLACRAPEPPPAPQPPALPDAESGETGNTGTTGDTGTVPVVEVDDCETIAPGPFPFQSTNAVRTEEDFDFDIQGYLICQHLTDLAGFTRQGQAHVVAAGIGSDAAGIRSLSTGDIVVAQPSSGSLVLVDPYTGNTSVILGGLSSANGLEASTDGKIYSSEYRPNGRVRVVDPYNGDTQVIGQLDWPNNMALSPDELTLYVVAGLTTGWVVAFDRDKDGEWSETPRMVYEHPQMLGGITSDKCGNLYIVEYSGGRVFRLPVSDPATPEPIADLQTGGSFSSLRFTSGVGDWGPTELFVTSRSQLFYLDVQIEGRHVLAPSNSLEE